MAALGDRRRAATLLTAVTLSALLGAVVTVRAPGLAFAGALVGGTAGAALTRWSGGSTAESASVGLLSAPFGLLFGAGVVRGLRMAAEPRD